MIRPPSIYSKTKVLVVEDAAVVREFLMDILDSDPGIEVIGTAGDGEEAIEAVRMKRPDVITMDINMPKMNGLEATRRIMEMTPTPIVIVSGAWDPEDVATTFQAIEAGALTIIQRPAGLGHPEHETMKAHLLQTVKLMAEVKVIRRWNRQTLKVKREEFQVRPPEADAADIISPEIRILALGASTGGPVAIQTLLRHLAPDLPVPLALVQHMTVGFTQGFAHWLGQTTGFPVHMAAHGERLIPGHVYVAPEGLHLAVTKEMQAALSREDPENGLRPSVSHLFRSVAEAFGRHSIGVLLTGMGKDGAEELKLLRRTGALTFAQDEESSVVFGMPGEAVKLNGATHVLPPEKIAAFLKGLIKG
ncbi:MAG: chemotaxis-specific protein-glutamate methyltransferase CheB [Pseudomonadota bacterium]